VTPAPPSSQDPPVTVEQLLDDARRRLRRLTPDEAFAAVRQGALLIDIRSDGQHERDGTVPGSHFVARNVLEWRLDPACPHRDDALARPHERIILLCDEGFQSSLAAATLQQLGLRHTTDVIGGFQAWRTAGLPVHRPPT
jgi:rhodanese-related sulfurtransferase